MPVLAFGTKCASILLHVWTLLVEFGVLKRLETQEVLERVAKRAQTRQELVVNDRIGQHSLLDHLLELVVLTELLIIVVGHNHGVLLLGELENGRILLILELGRHTCWRVVQDATFHHALELLAWINTAENEIRICGRTGDCHGSRVSVQATWKAASR